MSLSLHQIWRNVALHHCLSNGCSAVNGCRQNESLNSWLKQSPVVSHIEIQPRLFRAVLVCKRCLICADFSPDSDQNTCHWRKRYYGLWYFLNDVLFLTNTQLLSSPDVNWWTGVVWCFYQTLILTAPIHCRASIGSHSDGTHSHPLLRHWCNATFLQIWRRNKLIYISEDLRVNTFLATFHSRANYSFKGHRRILKCVQESIISSWTITPEPWLQFSSNVCSTLQLYYRHTDTFLRLFLTMCHINACANVHSEVNMLRLWLWWCLNILDVVLGMRINIHEHKSHC